MSPKTTATKPTRKSGEGFTAEEKAAMKARVQELKAEANANKSREEGEKAIFAAIAQMSESDRMIAERLHVIINECAPDLMPKTWYGMPAYANKDGKIICFYQAASKFNTRYGTLGFQHDAALDDGNMWPTSFALLALTATEEAAIRTLIEKAVH
jgi:uncharacterized protein YdhG (YjbR/CyaY superfamily)